VLSRYFLIEEDIAKGATKSYMERLAYELIPEGEASDFNQAIMELGALVCTPKSPACLICPVMERCAGRLAGKEEQLPVKSRAKPPRPEYRVCALVEGSGENEGLVLLRRRSEKGLLASMWELPHAEFGEAGWPAALPDDALGELFAEYLSHESGVAAAAEGSLGVAEHTFSHIHWNLRVLRFKADESARSERAQAQPRPPYEWVGEEGLSKVPMPNVFIRILRDAKRKDARS
jgi:A/G-specific adenine glycosylase